ncbi:MAG: hypothetical protein IT436_15015 [Phycisphaerales bacterium]|nr:hypothetical protein [Phycisphaerales bacterium]
MRSMACRNWLIALAASAGSATSALAQTAATWTGGSGVWDDPTLWSTNPFYPDKDNPLGATYNAFLPATTGLYTVTLNRAITLTDLGISTSDATLDLTDFVMTLERNLSLTGGAKLIGTGGGGTGRITIAGSAAITGSTIQGVSRFTTTGSATLADAALLGVGLFESLGTLSFQGSGVDEICDTGIGHGGSACDWTGTGDILFDGTSFFTHGSASTFTITNDRTMLWSGSGTRPVFTNDGVVVKTTGAGTTFIDGVDFTNSATGALRVQSGTFHANRLTNIAGGSLTTGTYEINGVLQADGADITALSTRFTLDGPGAAFVDQTGAASGFRNLASISTGGNLTLRNGTSLNVAGGLSLSGDAQVIADTGVAVSTGPAGVLAVDGTAAFTVRGAGSTLSAGGDVSVSSSAAFTADTGAVVTQAGGAAVVVQGTGTLTVQGAATSFTSGGTVDVLDASSLLVASGGQFATGGGTRVDGVLSVAGSASRFRVAPGAALLNIAGGTITGGTFDLAGGTLQVDNADVSTVASKISLTGSSAAFVDQTGTQSALRNLAVVDTTGDLTFATGLGFSTVGGLSVNAGGHLTSTAAGTQITVNGDATVNGTLTVGAGAVTEVAPAFTITNFSGGVFTGGTFDVVGTLRFNPDEPVRTIAGDVTFGSSTAGIVTFSGDPVFAPVDRVEPAGRFKMKQGFQFTTQGALRSLGAIAIGKPGGDADTILTVAGDLEQEAGTVSLDEGRLVVLGTFRIAAGASLDGIGTVEGSIENHGTISPGITTGIRGPGGAGTLSILGDLVTTLAGGDPGKVMLKMEVGGTIAGEQYDQLAISGLLDLAAGDPAGIGVVELSLLPGYIPADGDSYVLVTFDMRNGRFAEYRAPQVPGGGEFLFRLDDHALIATYRLPGPGAIPTLLSGLLVIRRRSPRGHRNPAVIPSS